MAETKDFIIEMPEGVRVEVGTSQTKTMKITNITGFVVEELKVTSSSPDAEPQGNPPARLGVGESFEMQIFYTAKEWKDDGIKAIIQVVAIQVSR